MTQSKRIHSRIFLAVLLASLLAGNACEGPDLVGSANHKSNIESATPRGDFFFNPQPEPPARIFSIETVGDPAGSWQGQFRDADLNGRITVETLSSTRKGKTLHLRQTWTLHPPDPIQPIQITMKGVLNFMNGKVVMDGFTDTNDASRKNRTKAHFKGSFAETGTGAISVGGELMFNPQPEPPARNIR